MSMKTVEQLILFKRLIIIFGSICCLWLIIGLIFLSIETYRCLKSKKNLKLFRHYYSLTLPSSLLIPNEKSTKDENLSDHDPNDDEPTNIYVSVPFVTEQSKIYHENKSFTSSCRRTSEKQFEFIFSNLKAISKLSFSQIISSSTNNFDKSLVNYPASQNFAYSHSTLSLSNPNENISQSSGINPLTNSLLSQRQLSLQHPLSTSSTITNLSQLTHTTYLSSQSSLKTVSLPTVMITDVDRLHTDIIELEDFEPEQNFPHIKTQLKCLHIDGKSHEIN